MSADDMRPSAALSFRLAIGCACLALVLGACSKKSPARPEFSGWRVTGTLRFENGAPAPVVYVNLTQRIFPLTLDDDLYLGRALTDASGRFTFESVAAGYFALHAQGPADTLVAGEQFVLGGTAPAGSTREIPLTLVRPGTFRGVVRRSDATRHDNIAVQINGAPLLAAETDTLGRWEIPGIPPGEWTALALSLDFRYAPDSATGRIEAPGDSARLHDMVLVPFPTSGKQVARKVMMARRATPGQTLASPDVVLEPLED